MSNLKAGNLALLVKATIDSNLMKCVELVRQVKEGEVVDGVALAWCDGWLISGDIVSGWLLGIAVCPDSWLMPLRGDFQLEQQKSREVPA